MHRGRRGGLRTRQPDARSRLTPAEVGGGWWRCGRMVEAAPEQPPPTSPNLPQPPPTSSLRDQTLQRIARPFWPPVAALERRDVQRDGRQVVEQDRPRGERAHRREALQVPLARVAHLDLARLLARLRREVAEVVVPGFVTERTAQVRDRPSRAAAPAPQLALALEPDVLDHHRPRPAERAVTLPPRTGQLARQAAGARLEQRQGRHLSEDADGVRLRLARSRQRVNARIVVAHPRLEQFQPVDSPQVPRGAGGELDEAADPAPGRTPVDRYPRVGQHRRLDGSLRRRGGLARLPQRAVFTLAERCLEEPEAGPGLGVVAAGSGHPLLDLYVPRVPNSGIGPEHFTFTVRQGVR